MGKIKVTAIGISCLLSALVFACGKKEPYMFKETRTAMYTLTSITAVSTSEKDAAIAIDLAFKELDRLEKLLNYYDNKSEVAEINRNAGIRPVSVSAETLELVEKAVYVAENTEGAFDITLGPVISLWDFKGKKMPDAEKLSSALKRVGYKNIVVDRQKRTIMLKKSGMEINLGGILKGYAADRAAEVLMKNGIMSGLVSCAGDIKTFGTKPDGTPWNVGIQNPRAAGKADELLAVVDLRAQGISTAGDYERFFIKDGVRYNHILDPKTGRPAMGCRSVTVITEKGVNADGFDTGIFVLGPKKGMETLKRLGFEGVIVDAAGRVHVTEGLKKDMRFL